MADYQRARSPQQKAERMSAIMDATETLFAQLPYHEINMGLIAKELGWSRSNLYKYAATQEEIFLALHSRANRALVDDLMASLAGKKLTNAEFAHEWACAVARHPEFLRYQSILIPIIETNIAAKASLMQRKRSLWSLFVPHLSSGCALQSLQLRRTGGRSYASCWLAAHRGQFRGCLHQLRRNVPRSSFAIKKAVPSA